jgi:molecular chaperone GrpE
LHEAVAMQPAGEFAPGSVMEVFRKGYRLQDRLLRPARVVVASEESGEESEETGSGSADETADPT